VKKKSLYTYLVSKIKIVLLFIKTGNLNAVIHAIRVRIRSKKSSIGFLKDIRIPFEFPQSSIKLSIRLFEESDINTLQENFRHIGLIRAEIPRCYTAVTHDNVPCFRMWLMKSDQNKRIDDYFRGLFPKLKDDEALVEGVFTNPDFRGLKIMSYVLGKISEEVKEEGINKLIAFVDVKNIASLKGFKQSGFNPYILRRTKWLFFKRTVSFEPVPLDVLEAYEKSTSSNISSLPINIEGIYYF
jgi:GNAT superfamily N-acetyltransferase